VCKRKKLNLSQSTQKVTRPRKHHAESRAQGRYKESELDLRLAENEAEAPQGCPVLQRTSKGRTPITGQQRERAGRRCTWGRVGRPEKRKHMGEPAGGGNTSQLKEKHKGEEDKMIFGPKEGGVGTR